MSDLYFSSTLMWNNSLEEIFFKAYSEGFKGIELWMQHFDNINSSIEEVNRLKKKYPINLFIHAYSWDLNISSLNDEIRNSSVNEIIKTIYFAKKIGASEITVHPGRDTLPNSNSKTVEYLYNSLDLILSTAKETEIKVSLEIMEKIPKESMTSLSKFKLLLKDNFKHFNYTLDIAHCDSIKEIDSYLNNPESMKFITKFHISNRKDNRYHTPLYDGDFNFTELLLKLAQYNIPLVIEGLCLSHDSITLNNNINFIKKIKEDILCQRKVR